MIGNMKSMHGKTSTRSPAVIILYCVFAAVALVVFHWLAEGEFSAVLTLSAVFQCLAFSLLGVQAISTNSAAGISAKSLKLDAVALACRLSSTLWLQGYLPADQTGDYLYQVFDVLSLGMVLWLLYFLTKVQVDSYDAEEDRLSPSLIALACFLLAVIFHGDLDDRPAFDTFWMCGLFISAVSVLPQLSMMTRGRATVPALISHFVAVMALSRILSGTYMWHAHEEITCEPWIGEFNHAGYAILAAHVVHLLFLADFGYFYTKHLATAGLNEPLQLPETFTV